VWPNIKDIPRLETLEKLPFLTACIKEALRMAPTSTSELSRVVPKHGATIGGEQIPGNTIVSMGVLFAMKHADAFPEPDNFMPQRWLNLADGVNESNKYFVPFSKGPRSCLGLNFAWAELYLTFANLFRRFDLTLDGTKPEDFEWIDVGVAMFTGPHFKCFCRPVQE